MKAIIKGIVNYIFAIVFAIVFALFLDANVGWFILLALIQKEEDQVLLL